MGSCHSNNSQSLEPIILHQIIPNNLNRKELPKFRPRINHGRVIEVYDGDTITIATHESGDLFQFQVRLMGIDTPERRTKDASEKEVALIAKQELEEMISGEIVQLHNVDLDKYGRILANVMYHNKDVGVSLIEKRLAVPYFGKTKKSPTNWMQFYKSGTM